jgi:predicted RNA binding protein YcfA (HicA-like mRNA interferase family)
LKDDVNDSNYTIFAKSNNNKSKMKRYKVKEVIRMLEAEGWQLSYQKGSHRQFKHPTKAGKVTVNDKPSETLDQEILNSIWKQAGWK